MPIDKRRQGKRPRSIKHVQWGQRFESCSDLFKSLELLSGTTVGLNFEQIDLYYNARLDD